MPERMLLVNAFDTEIVLSLSSFEDDLAESDGSGEKSGNIPALCKDLGRRRTDGSCTAGWLGYLAVHAS